MQRVEEPFDVVITTNSGYPLDMNLYQGVKGMSAGARIIKPGGTLILAAECREGIPPSSPLDKLLRAVSSPEDLLALLAQPGFVRAEQWQAQIQAIIQRKARVLVYSTIPDDVIRADAELWSRLVGEAAPVLDYLFDAAARKHDLSSPRERSAAMSDLTPMIASISDRVVQSHYLQRLSRMVQVDEQTLRLELRRPVRRSSSNEATDVPARRAESARDRKEEFCLALLFKYPELRAEGLEFDAGLFAYSENRALFETWVGWADSGEPFEESLSPDLRPQYERILSLALPLYDDDALIKALHDSVQRIEEQRLRLAKRASAAVLADIAASGGATIAERALSVWQTGNVKDDTAEDEADPAVAFVEDMEAGLKVHQRVLGQHRSTERPAR